MIDKVTITGADDSVSPDYLVSLSRKYPFVEWGILISAKQEGNYRFPSRKWINEFLKIVTDDMNISCHVCGRWVRNIIEHADVSVLKELPGVLERFQRIQLNFHDEDHVAANDFPKALKESLPDKQFIFQYDNFNQRLFVNAVKNGINAVPLFDTSGGVGVLPAKWPKALSGLYCGYAGGLGPDSLQEQLPLIEQAANGQRIWIDMERRVRSNDDSAFLLDKVKECLDISSDFFGKQLSQ